MKYKRLYLTEKSTQVVALAEVENAKMSGINAYNDAERIAIVPLQGHVVINEDVRKYAEEFNKFSEDNLKDFPERLKLRPNPNTLAKYNSAIEHLKEAEEIVIATDFDEAGAAIAMNIIERAGAENRVAFMLEMGSTHPKELRKYIDNPTDIPYREMAESDRARAWVDFVEGMYYSRALSMYLGNKYETKINYGGVKAPITYIVVERDLAYENHKVSYYWTVKGEAIFNGKKFNVDVKLKKEDIDKKGNKKIIWDNKFDSEQDALEAIKNIENKEFKIAKHSSKEPFSTPPKLCDLSTIQEEMSNKYKLLPSKTMELAQEMYDNPVSIESYPRTEIPYLKSSEYADVPAILENLKSVMDNDLIDKILNGKIPKRSSTFNDKEVVAHGAIVPTLHGDYTKWLNKLSANSKNLFMFVSARYVANFMEDYMYKSISGETEEINDLYKITYSENIPLSAGWKVLFDKNIEKTINDYEIKIPNDLEKGSVIRLSNLIDSKNETKPKPPFTMATLLAAMKNIANLFPDNEEIKKYLKKSGIGTPATRSKIIDELMNADKNAGEPMLIEKNSKIISSKKAREYIKHIPLELVSPIKRALLSKKLKEVSSSDLKYEDVVRFYHKEVSKNIEVIKEIVKKNGPIKASGISKDQSLGKCPLCGNDIIERKKAFICKGAKFEKVGEDKIINKGCKYMIRKSSLDRFGKKNITKTEVMRLLKNKEVDVELVAKGSGNKYKATAIIDTTFGISVDFNRNKKK